MSTLVRAVYRRNIVNQAFGEAGKAKTTLDKQPIRPVCGATQLKVYLSGSEYLQRIDIRRRNSRSLWLWNSKQKKYGPPRDSCVSHSYRVFR